MFRIINSLSEYFASNVDYWILHNDISHLSLSFPFQELDLLDTKNTVYKLIGPVLVKQDLDEAKATVTKRLEYINGEM